ncbi:hypothetical protein BJX65DRAFT_292354 [Aspergillus insuetus]
MADLDPVDSKVHALDEFRVSMRDAELATGLSRIKHSVATYKLQLPLNFEVKLQVVTGDITDPTLGLSPEHFDELAQRSSIVFHFASMVDYSLPYSSHRAQNVLGLLNMIHLSNTKGLKPLHYTSSISACYTSKFLPGYLIAAERVAWNAIANGFPLIIYRRGVITGHSVTGAYPPGRMINILMAGCVRSGYFPLPPDAKDQLITVDFVCSAILSIALEHPTKLHWAYNLVRPDQEESTTWKQLFEILSEVSGAPLRSVSVSEWVGVWAESGTRQLLEVVSLLRSQANSLISFWGSDGCTPAAFETRNARQALSHSPHLLQVPSVTELVSTYLSLWS